MGYQQAHFRKEPIGPAFKQGIIDIFSALAAGARNMVSVALATAAAGIIVGVVALKPEGRCQVFQLE